MMAVIVPVPVTILARRRWRRSMTPVMARRHLIVAFDHDRGGPIDPRRRRIDQQTSDEATDESGGGRGPGVTAMGIDAGGLG